MLSLDGFAYRTHNFLKGFLIKMSSDSPVPVVVAGLNQSKKHIKGGTAKAAFVASDAEGKIISAVTELCRDCGIALDLTRTKTELGKMCGIDVDCAVCVVLK